jgi:transcriptional/translational regulatory protein YebC/TACO1
MRQGGGGQVGQMLKLYDALDDHDDVQNVYANFEMDDAAMEQGA